MPVLLAKCIITGLITGAVTGILGSGGGMILLPMLRRILASSPHSLFPISLSVMLPICLASLLQSLSENALDFTELLPYLIGSLIGGIFASCIRGHIPIVWLHRLFGLILLWGGFQCILRSA